jgi:RNA methyltransferase, TrmH family
MLSKKLVKDIQSLGRKKHREETGLFVAEGPKTVLELLALIPGQIETIVGTEEWIKSNQSKLQRFPLVTVAGKDLEKITQLQTPNEVLVVARQLRSIPPVTNEGIVLFLDRIQDPGNLGTIIRIADWFGISNIVCTEGCADIYNPKVIQSTMASIARVNVWYDKEGTWLEAVTMPLIATTMKGRSVYERGKIVSGVIMVGNESKGLDEIYIAKATEKISIPRIGGAESLNAAVATGIILSHLSPTRLP